MYMFVLYLTYLDVMGAPRSPCAPRNSTKYVRTIVPQPLSIRTLIFFSSRFCFPGESRIEEISPSRPRRLFNTHTCLHIYTCLHAYTHIHHNISSPRRPLHPIPSHPPTSPSPPHSRAPRPGPALPYTTPSNPPSTARAIKQLENPCPHRSIRTAASAPSSARPRLAPPIRMSASVRSHVRTAEGPRKSSVRVRPRCCHVMRASRCVPTDTQTDRRTRQALIVSPPYTYSMYIPSWNWGIGGMIWVR